jgi:hypothetical protein
MNIIDIQDQLKNFSENQLIQEMQMPSGTAPQFLVLSEIQRRKRVRDDFAKRNAAMEQTVAQEAVAAAGVPMQGIAGMSEAMAPQSAASDGIGTIMPQSMRQAVPDAPEMPMQEGGLIESLFKGRESLSEASKRPEIRRHKDGRRAMYKPGTNIFLGYVQEDEMYDGGVVRAQNGLPRGLRLRNPGNIRPGAGFYGETGDDGGYAQFESDEAGIRAIQRLLGTYGSKYGINTLRGLANRYAPPSDNNPTGNYIDFLSQQTGIDPDEEIDLAGRGSDIIPAIIGFEQGQQPFSQELINRAIEAAGTEDPDEISNILESQLPAELTDAGVTAQDLFQADAEPGMMSAMASTNDTDKPSSVSDFFSKYILGPKGREIAGTSTPDELEAIRQAGEGARTGEVIGERQAVSEGYDDYVDRARSAGVIPAEPDEFLEQRKPDESGVSPLDRKTMSNVAAVSTQAKPEIDDSTKTDDADTEAGKAAGDLGNLILGTSKPDGEVSDLEGEIKALQAKMEKNREQDKWLALAQAGMALMSSKEPTMMGALGEAGISGLTAMREAQQRYEEGVVDLINARAKLQKDSDKGDLTGTNIISRIGQLTKALSGAEGAMMSEEEKQAAMNEIIVLKRMAGIPVFAAT